MIQEESETPFPSAVRAWALVLTLMGVYVLAFLDRQLLSLLVEPIKRDLAVSDTGIGLLQGFAFALFLALAALPIGRWVDTSRRTRIIALGLILWSIMTAACGCAGTYGALLLCRIGVGVGEATMTPASYSLIGDCFPARRLGLAIGLYSAGSYIGVGLAYVIGAFILSSLPSSGEIAVPPFGSFHSWQMVFIVAGLPGVLVALGIAKLQEPARQGGGARRKPDLAQVVAYFGENARCVALLNMAIACAAMMTFSALAWIPSFMIRRYGWTIQQVGGTYGLTVMASGMIGLLFGGISTDFVIARGVRNGRLVVMVILCLCAVPFAGLAPLAGTPWRSLLLFAIAQALTTAASTAGTVAQQEMVPGGMRGAATSLGTLAVYIVGLGLGPTLVALVTDDVIGDESRIGFALAGSLPLMLLASAVLAASCLRPYLSTLGRLAVWHRCQSAADILITTPTCGGMPPRATRSGPTGIS